MVVFSAILSLPVDSRASVSYKTEVSYNSTENKREGQTTAKTVQERFAAIMNVNSSLSSKLRMTGLLRFDLVMRENVNGSESTELQPNINLKFSTNAVQLNTGYRQITRDESIITGNTTTEQTTETTDAVLDAVIRAGALPDTRLRYNSRDNLRVESGATVEDTNTTEVRAAFNYKLGIFALNADYSNQTDKNNVDSSEQTRTQASGQLLANKRFSNKVSVILRESYFLAKTTDTNADDTKRNNSISEARLIFSPIERSLINTNFLYSVQDSENGSSKTDTTETNFFTTASYVLPKYLRFYGSFTTRETDTDTTDKLLLTTDNSVVNVDTTVWGVNFKHSVGKFNIVARYESRTDKTDTDDTAAAVVSTSVEATRNNFDWLVDAQLTRYLSLALSEAYVLTERTDSTGGSSSDESNRYRLKANIGPIKNLVLSPYIDWISQVAESDAAESLESTTTELVVPATYKLDIGDRVNITFTDNYRRRMDEIGGTTSESSTNNAVLRLAIPALTKSLSFSGDASFNTSTTETTTTTTTSSSTYTFRLSWARNPHRLNTNLGFQTGKNMPNSTSAGIQYLLALRLKKVSLRFQASYTYNVVQGNNNPKSTGQTILMLLSLSN